MPDHQVVLQAVFFVALLLIAAINDMKTRTIPNFLCLVIAVISLLDFRTVNLLGLLIALPFLITAMIIGGMGGGDIKLMAACGLVLGLPSGIMATIIGLSTMLIYAGIYNTVQKLGKREGCKTFPLAPFLGIGCIAAYLMKLGGLNL